MNRSRARVRHVISAVLLAMLVVAGAAATATAGVKDSKALPPTFAGVVADDAFAAPLDQQRVTLADVRRSGVTMLRRTFDWAELEPARGAISFGLYDRFVLEAARAGLEIMPIVYGTPAWQSSRPPGSDLHGMYPPRDFAAFAGFARAIVQRYGRGGSLWAEHPDVPARPIINYQVWNEPNLTIYWLPKINPAAYTRLLTQAGAAIRSVDPTARIVLGGMPIASHLGARLTDYLRGMYGAGARGKFDIVSVHAYATSSASLMAALRDARATVMQNRDPTVGLWATEFGWGAGGPKGTYNAGADRQASLIGATIKAMGTERRALNLQGFVYYGWRDQPPYEGRTDFWGFHTGLHWLDGRPKPAAFAFTKAVQALGVMRPTKSAPPKKPTKSKKPKKAKRG